jgi:hypothetical protein
MNNGERRSPLSSKSFNLSHRIYRVPAVLLRGNSTDAYIFKIFIARKLTIGLIIRYVSLKTIQNYYYYYYIYYLALPCAAFVIGLLAVDAAH